MNTLCELEYVDMNDDGCERRRKMNERCIRLISSWEDTQLNMLRGTQV